MELEQTLRCISNEGDGAEEVNVFYERGPHGLGRAAVPSGLLCLAPSTWPGQESNPPLTQLLASSLSHTQLLAGLSQQDADPHTHTPPHTQTHAFTHKTHFTDCTQVHKPNLKLIFIFNAKLKCEPDINNKWQNITVSTFKPRQLLKKIRAAAHPGTFPASRGSNLSEFSGKKKKSINQCCLNILKRVERGHIIKRAPGALLYLWCIGAFCHHFPPNVAFMLFSWINLSVEPLFLYFFLRVFCQICGM